MTTLNVDEDELAAAVSRYPDRGRDRDRRRLPPWPHDPRHGPPAGADRLGRRPGRSGGRRRDAASRRRRSPRRACRPSRSTRFRSRASSRASRSRWRRSRARRRSRCGPLIDGLAVNEGDGIQVDAGGRHPGQLRRLGRGGGEVGGRCRDPRQPSGEDLDPPRRAGSRAARRSAARRPPRRAGSGLESPTTARNPRLGTNSRVRLEGISVGQQPSTPPQGLRCCTIPCRIPSQALTGFTRCRTVALKSRHPFQQNALVLVQPRTERRTSTEPTKSTGRQRKDHG